MWRRYRRRSEKYMKELEKFIETLPENKENKKLLENCDLEELKLEIEIKKKEQKRQHKSNIEWMKIEAEQQKLV